MRAWYEIMVIALLIQLLAGVSVAFAAAVCLYYVFLVLVALASWRPHFTSGPHAHTFAVLIPAHNEEAHIAEALDACAAFDYPRERYRVFVVADNCTDRTAAIASAHGAVCLERHDATRRGKGAALAWALDRVLAEPVDAVLILDADCRLNPEALRTFDRNLAMGHKVLQASYIASNLEQSAVSYVAGVASRIENDLFYLPKALLGSAVLLRGTGMVFHREILQACPWHADSIVEDVEYTILLARAGVAVRFVPEAIVASAFPAQKQQLNVQRTRWVSGNFRLALAHVAPLLWDSFRHGRPWLIDLAWTLIASMRSLMVLQFLSSVFLAALAYRASPGPVSEALLASAAALTVLYALYFGFGIWRLGVNRRRLQLLLGAPLTVVRLLLIAARSILPGQVRSWERTPR
jgi:cellulose synthase/poly-beta-1,6-N-acetylglucosamine synthase-like glycosyltransferase